MKKTLVIDWILVPTFLSTALTGICLHIAGHGSSHDVWHNWAVAHILTSLLFLTAAICHIKFHWPWYKNLFINGIGRKSRITLALTVVFLLLTLTGILLLAVEGANSRMGIWHYATGLVMTLFSVWHTARHISVYFRN